MWIGVKGILPFLEPGQVEEIELEIGVLEGDSELDSFIRHIQNV